MTKLKLVIVCHAIVFTSMLGPWAVASEGICFSISESSSCSEYMYVNDDGYCLETCDPTTHECDGGDNDTFDFAGANHRIHDYSDVPVGEYDDPAGLNGFLCFAVMCMRARPTVN